VLKKLAIFASGSGSNAENIYAYFSGHSEVEVVFFCTNKQDAFIVKRAEKLNIPVIIITKTELNNFDRLYKKLQNAKIDFIILAGFLLKLPAIMVKKYQNRILNIHPSLLPKYGGRGMYGDKVHEAVLANKEIESGISIHFVNQNYDEGKLILQKTCSVSVDETLETLTSKIQQLEQKYFPPTIEKAIKNYKP